MTQSHRSAIRGDWNLKRLSATVINDIAVEVTFFTVWALAVQLITKYKTDLSVNPAILTVLGTVLGFCVSFRTTSAYDRFWEGRKLWSTLALASKNLAQVIWIQIPTDRKPGPDGVQPDDRLKAIIEKKSMINLVQAYSVSVKHHLRGEVGIFYEDLYHLLALLPKTTSLVTSSDEQDQDTLPMWHSGASTPNLHESPALKKSVSAPELSPDGTVRGSVDMEKNETATDYLGYELPKGVKLLPARNPPKESVYDYAPFLLPVKPIVSLVMYGFRPAHLRKSNRNWMGRKIKPEISIANNVPLEISCFLQSYLAFVLRNDLLKPATATAFVNGLQSFQDVVTSLERIRSTPIPFAYQMHLRMSTWLYLLLLPFQTVKALNWLIIPGTAFAAFLFLGFLEIGAEIEDPFYYDANDLDLDGFCEDIAKELSEITAHPVVEPHSYIFGEFNRPFWPGDVRSASVILNNTQHAYHDPEDGMRHVQRTLLRSWKTTNDVSRMHHRKNSGDSN